MKYVLHQFGQGQTIDAVIRYRGRHNLTQEEMIPLRAEFYQMNGEVIPKLGMTYKIPLPANVEVPSALESDDHGDKVKDS